MTEEGKTPPEQKPNRRQFINKAAKYGAIVTGGGAAAGLGVLSLPGVQRDLIYQPGKDIKGNDLPPLKEPQEYGLKDIVAEELYTESGSFTAWHSAQMEPGKMTLVFFPGNFGHLGSSPEHGPDGEDLGREGKDDAYIQMIRAAQSKGYQIMAVNYVGYAGSDTKKPTQAGFYQGAEKTIDWLLEQGIKPKDMDITGVSMGSPIAAHAARHLSEKPEFRNDPRQTLNVALVNGMIDMKVGLGHAVGAAAEKLADAILWETLDAGKELRAMAKSGNAARIRVNYIRGIEDNLTPADQPLAHEDAAGRLDFRAIDVPGRHFPDPMHILQHFKNRGKESSPAGRGR